MSEQMRTSATRTVNGLALHDYPGDGSDGPTVVLLPSLAQSRRSWVGAARLLGPEIRCLAIDPPGQGDSPYPARFLSIFDFADAVAGVLFEEAVGGAIVVGNSLGAVIASQLAVSHPALVDSLVLVGAPVWADEKGRREWLHSRSELLVGPDGLPRETTKEAVEALFGQYDADRHRLMREDGQKAGRALGWTIWALYGFEYAQALTAVEQPVLAVYGSRDWLKDLSMPTLATTVARLSVETVEDGSHLLPLDKPGELAALITGWTRATSRAKEESRG